VQVGDSVWIKSTGEGPFVIVAKWTGASQLNISKPCLVVCSPDCKPMGTRHGGFWFGSPSKFDNCNIILEAVCTTERPERAPTKFELLVESALLGISENFGILITISIIALAIATVAVTLK
jgi:hypothetical protein